MCTGNNGRVKRTTHICTNLRARKDNEKNKANEWGGGEKKVFFKQKVYIVKNDTQIKYCPYISRIIWFRLHFILILHLYKLYPRSVIVVVVVNVYYVGAYL